MRLILWSLLASAISLQLGPACAEDLVLFATTSTTEAITEATQKFTEEFHLTVALQFASPGALVAKVEGGATPNLVVLDGKSWMDRLAGKKAIASDTRRPLFSNRLALITHRDFPHALLIAPELPLRELLGDSKFAIADPSVDPAGELARAALQSIGVLRQVEDRLQLAPDVRSALRLIDSGETDAGIIYASDARTSNQINLSGVFLRSMHPPIVYEIAIIAGNNSSAAKRLETFLLSKAANRIYGAHAFVLE